MVLGLRNEILRMLMSYTPLWLRVGLEAILGEAIHLRSPDDTAALKVSTVNRFVGLAYCLIDDNSTMLTHQCLMILLKL